MGGTGCLGARASMDLPRATQAPQPGMLFKASRDHSSPQLWTRDERWGAGKGQPRRDSQSSSQSDLGQLAGLEQVDKGTCAAPSGHMEGGILRLAFHMGDQEPESVFTLFEVAVPL